MLRNLLVRFIKWLWDQADAILALLLAAICSILGLLGVVPASLLSSATLATLTVLALVLMRNRAEREKTEHRLDQLLSQLHRPLPDTFFTHKTEEIPLLQEAEREIWLVQETGSLIGEKAYPQIASLLRRGGAVRVVVTAPTDIILRFLAFRNHPLTSEALKARSGLFNHLIEGILKNIGTVTEQLQVRFLPYPTEVTSVIIDPQSEVEKKRKAIIRYAGFRIAFDEKLDYSIQGDTSPRVFSHYFREAQQFFLHSSKIVLLTGEPGCGKTTLMAQLVENLSPEDQILVFSVISRAVLDKNKRVGFEVVTSENVQPRRFATRRDDGSYDVDGAVWTGIAAELEQASKDGKIIVLDEIGPMQLQNQAFTSVVEKIANDPMSTLFATIASEDSKNFTLRKMKLHYRSTVLLLTSNKRVRNTIEKELEKEIKSSLYVATRIPHTLYKVP